MGLIATRDLAIRDPNAYAVPAHFSMHRAEVIKPILNKARDTVNKSTNF
jgi:hypothetical protein